MSVTVFRDKKCTIVIEKPAFGDSGFIKDGSGLVSEVFYDKGGVERLPRAQGNGLTRSEPGWVDRVELTRRKNARSRAWKKSLVGQNTFLRMREARGKRATGDCFERWGGRWSYYGTW